MIRISKERFGNPFIGQSNKSSFYTAHLVYLRMIYREMAISSSIGLVIHNDLSKITSFYFTDNSFINKHGEYFAGAHIPHVPGEWLNLTTNG